MEYKDEFEKKFMNRTLEIVKDYKGNYDATIIINCLLGLLVLPREISFDKISDESIENIKKWGINRESIKNTGRPNNIINDPNTLKSIIYNLRNSVAHFQITPVEQNREVVGFKFKTNIDFLAVLSLQELINFVEYLSQKLKNSY